MGSGQGGMHEVSGRESEEDTDDGQAGGTWRKSRGRVRGMGREGEKARVLSPPFLIPIPQPLPSTQDAAISRRGEL